MKSFSKFVPRKTREQEGRLHQFQKINIGLKIFYQKKASLMLLRPTSTIAS